jgi:hypothetical protein
MSTLPKSAATFSYLREDVGGLGEVTDVVADLETVLCKRLSRQLQVIGTAGKNGDPGAWRRMIAI